MNKVVFIFLFFLQTSFLFSNDIKLTKIEKDYLKNKKVINLCVDPDWMPYEMIENGKHVGMTADYIKLLE